MGVRCCIARTGQAVATATTPTSRTKPGLQIGATDLNRLGGTRPTEEVIGEVGRIVGITTTALTAGAGASG